MLSSQWQILSVGPPAKHIIHQPHQSAATPTVSFEEEEEMLAENFALMSNIKSIMTPFGIMPLTEQSLASQHFKFWVGHANFKLTDKVYNIVGNTPGVETLDILTPYRFRIAIGKMFVDRDVMSTVRTNLLEYIKDADYEQKDKTRRQ